jgi:hypothetical protein
MLPLPRASQSLQTFSTGVNQDQGSKNNRMEQILAGQQIAPASTSGFSSMHMSHVNTAEPFMPNNASQWRRAKRIRNGIETESRRPLHSPGYADSPSL